MIRCLAYVSTAIFQSRARLVADFCHILRSGYDGSVIRDLAMLFIHLVVTVARLLGPGGTRSVIAESLLVKHQLLILSA